jgi:hypothetical protein
MVSYSRKDEESLLKTGREIRNIIAMAVGEITKAYKEKYGREPDWDEVQYIVRSCLEDLGGNGQVKGAQEALETVRGEPNGHRNKESSDFLNEGGEETEGQRGYLHRVKNMEEARRIAEEVIESGMHYRIPSCDMMVHTDGEMVSLQEEQFLSDGTKVIGRSYIYENHDEAIESVARMLLEIAKDWKDGVVISKEDTHSERSNGDIH